MKKSELIEMLQDEFPEIDRKTIINIVNGTFEAMIEALSEGEKIEIRGLGTFKVKSRPAKIARNPKTGEKIKVPPKKVVHFKIGKVLKAKLNSKAGV
ncbi:integration host factor subunit beta [Persephonella hydrogeniphila]|uniref:Integration host factor subunit beta n=1 Tax=Persephonella hydrogeniphila TaxID=198703 RepID=A0A285N006_9AQUI|nr:HU family DNA-binding protein [Persephonella hydrogeniphila]SNZ02785.1 integration host factor subunit beta [Persephonella hydrogeniphila]